MEIEIITLIVAFINFLLGIIIYLKNKEHLANKSFAVFSIILGFWALSLYFYSQAFILSPLYWIKIVYFIGTFPMGFSLLFFSFIFPKRPERIPFKSLLLWIFISLPFLYLLFFTNLWVKEVISKPWGYETILGPAFPLILIYSSIMIGWVLFNFIRKYILIKNKVLKAQIKYVFFGIGLFTTTVTFIDIVIPLLFNTSRFFSLSPISSLFLVGFIARAIIKHHLFEVKLLATEALVGIMGGIMLIFPFLLPTVPLRLLSIGVLFAYCVFSYLLIKSTHQEIKRREEIEKISKELEEAKNKSEALLTSISDGVIGIDKDKKVIHLNLAAEKMISYKATDVLGKTYHDFLIFIRGEDRSKIDSFIPSALKGKVATINSGDTLLVRRDGSELPIEASASPIKSNIGKIAGAIIVFRDVTKERRLQQIQSEFSSLVSHELRSPVTVINGYLEMLGDEPEKLTERQRKSINNAKAASTRLLNLIEELLNIAQLEKESTKVEATVVSPIDLAKKALTKELLHLFEEKKQKFTFKEPKGLPEIKVNPTFIITPIQNLLSNASKYSPEGGKIELKIYSNPHDIIFQDEIVFQITDTGMGIPKKEQNKVFQRFFRASNTTNLTKGTGLGLYITKLMIESSGGRIWFSSEENKGTTFYIMLPLHKK